MGVITFDEFKAYAKFQIGQRTDVESATDEAVDLHGLWVNLAYKELCHQNRFHGLRINYDFPELKTDNSGTNTADGTAYVDTPTDMLGTPREVFDETSDIRLKWRPFNWYIKKPDRDTAASENEPKFWTIYGAGTAAGSKRMYLYPTPDAVYSIYIYYNKRVSSLSSGTDVLVIGEEWDQIVLQMAVCNGYKWLREWSNYEKEIAIVKESIAGIIGHETLSEVARDEKIEPEILYSQLDYYEDNR